MHIQRSQVYPMPSTTSSAYPFQQQSVPSYPISAMTMTTHPDEPGRASNLFKAIEADLLRSAKAIEKNKIKSSEGELSYSFPVFRWVFKTVCVDIRKYPCSGSLLCLSGSIGYMYIGLVPDLISLPITFPLDYIRSSKRAAFFRALENEINLLERCFLNHPTIETFQAYKKFISEHSQYQIKNWRAIKWGTQNIDFKKILNLLAESSFAFEGDRPDVKIPNTRIHKKSGILLLLLLPYLELDEINEFKRRKKDGATLLHRLVMNQETPLSILCIDALLEMGLLPYTTATGNLMGYDIDGQTPVDVAKRLNKRQFFKVLTNDANFEKYTIAPNGAEQKEAKLRAENEQKASKLRAENNEREAKVKNGLNKLLLYILKHDLFEKLITNANREHFLREAAPVLTTCPQFTIFQNNILARADYEITIYSEFKERVTRSIGDLKIKINSKEITFDRDELITIFSNAVISVERSLTIHDVAIKAHQETIKSQIALERAAVDSRNALFQKQDEEYRRQEAQQARQQEAAHQARMRAIYRTGVRAIEAEMNLF